MKAKKKKAKYTKKSRLENLNETKRRGKNKRYEKISVYDTEEQLLALLGTDKVWSSIILQENVCKRRYSRMSEGEGTWHI